MRDMQERVAVRFAARSRAMVRSGRRDGPMEALAAVLSLAADVPPAEAPGLPVSALTARGGGGRIRGAGSGSWRSGTAGARPRAFEAKEISSLLLVNYQGNRRRSLSRKRLCMASIANNGSGAREKNVAAARPHGRRTGNGSGVDAMKTVGAVERAVRAMGSALAAMSGAGGRLTDALDAGLDTIMPGRRVAGSPGRRVAGS
ncbi:MAG: hypothetical protein OXI22_16875, partial [Defluviicoccus sp.]|nr:hypothetical protein [Defluviicoccus sp.]